MDMTENSHPPKNDEKYPQAGRREWLGLAVLMLPTLLIAGPLLLPEQRNRTGDSPHIRFANRSRGEKP
jgi:hypothetical protein